VNVTGGYRIEGKIPWSTIGVTAVANNLVGVDFGINDSNVSGTRNCKIEWNETADNDWQNTSNFGVGKLVSSTPAAPTGLAASPGNAQAALTWNASTGATSYNVLRSTVSGSGYASVATGITTTSYTNTGLTNGTTYYFVVTATNSNGTSGNSAQASATPVAPPAAPTGLTANAGNTQAVLSWSASSGATSYNVLRSTVSGSGYASVVTGLSTTSYTNTGLTNGTTYYFVVTAANAGGTSGNSNEASCTPTGGATPPVPTGLAATSGNTQAALSWTASSGATSYNVLRSTVNGSGYASIATGITATNYYNTGLTNGTTYYFVATATNGNGTSGNSNQASSTPGTAPQAQIAYATTAPVIDGNIDAIWANAPLYAMSNLVGTLPAGANLTASYQLLWDTTNIYVLAIVQDSTLIANTDPTIGDSFEFYIDGDHNGGTTYDSNDWQYILPWNSATIEEWQHGAQGTNTTGVACSTVNITGGYRLEAKIPWSDIGVTPAANNLVGIDFGINDSNVSGTRACKIFWNTTADNDWQNPSLFGTGKLLPAVPAPPTGLAATAGNAQVALSWTASSGATSYNVLRSTVSGSGYATVTTGVSSTSYTNTGLTNGTTYYFVVTASNATGTSGNSNEASATPGGAPAAPSGMAGMAGGGQALIYWTASTGATSYNILRSTVSGSGYASLATGLTGASYDNTGLTNGTTYYYVTQAVNASGTSGNSSQAAVLPAAAPQAQIANDNGTAPVIDGNVDSVWSNATSYSIGNIMNYGAGTVTSAADLSGSYQTMWDSTNLYLLVTVTDDVLMQYLTNPWDGDSVEVYIDADNSKGTTYDSNDFQYEFPWNSTNMVETKHNATTGVVWAQTNITGGYRVELKIPWTTLTVTPAANNLVGIDVHINDADTTRGTRDSKVMWNDTTDTAWSNPSVFGAGKLNAASGPPPAPTGLTANPGNAQVALTWNASSGATSYNVKRSTVSGSGYVTVSSPTTTSYTNTGLTNGTTYYYVVSAVSSGGESANSSQVSATPTATTSNISIDFVGGSAGHGTPSSMGGTESAGVVALTNWNNCTGTSGTNVALNYSTGSSSGATVTYSCNDTWSTAITESAGNPRMMKGYLDDGNAGSTTVTINSLPSAITANGYDVYVYFDGDTSTACTSNYTIGSTTIVGTDPANTDFSGTFTQASGGSNGNYVKFTSLTGASFTLTASPASGSTRAPVNGIQIVGH
jgi:fibronectin type 3 domain-containing protein